MELKIKLISAALLIGLISGVFLSSAVASDSQTKCEKTENAIRNQSNTTGAIACFPPGVLDVNRTEKIEEGSDLECVCRRSYQGEVQIWAINKAS